MNIVEISNFQLLICLIFVLISGISSIILSLGLEKDIAVGTIRMFVQLFIMGFVLKYIFEINKAYLIILIFIGMIFFAALTIKGRINEKKVSFFLPT